MTALGPVDPAEVEQAATMLMLAMGIDPSADVTPDSFAQIASLRDGLLDVVRALDDRLARYTYLEHESHRGDAGQLSTMAGCKLCAAERGDATPTVVMQGRWGS